jgi:DNA-3-methyladenine glycosylase II
MERLRFDLSAPPPFDLGLTARVLRRSSRNPIDVVAPDGAWRRVVSLGDRAVALCVTQPAAHLCVEAFPASNADIAPLGAIVRRILGLDVDLGPFWRLADADPALGPLARRLHGLRPQRYATLFEAFANAICCQQLSLEAGLSLLGRLAALTGPRAEPGGQPGPPAAERVAEMTVHALHELGLPGRRAAALRDIASLPLHALEAELCRLPPREAHHRLRELQCVGPWTADYVLLRGLGRLDVYPMGDVGAARALSRIVGRPVSPAEAPAEGARFGPYAGMLWFCAMALAIEASKEAAPA